MKVGIIDIGSNSIRLMICERPLCSGPKFLRTTRLGDRDGEGRLKEGPILASFEAVKEMYERCEAEGVSEIYGLATSAVREAPNGQEFIDKLKSIGPMDLRIISGQEEARYGYLGATADFIKDGEEALVIDIGGGSTELALGDGFGLSWARSYPVGAVRYQGLSQEGPQAVWEETMLLWDKPPIKGPYRCFGIGGTVTNLAAMAQKLTSYDRDKVHGYVLERLNVEVMLMDLRHMSREERLEVPGLQPSRVDIIIPGGEILISLMDGMGLSSITVSDADGMEGFAKQIQG